MSSFLPPPWLPANWMGVTRMVLRRLWASAARAVPEPERVYSASLVQEAARICAVSMATPALAALAGWLAAPDALARIVALQLMLWFGASAFIAAWFWILLRYLLQPSPIWWNTRYTVGFLMAAYISWGVIETAQRAWSVLHAVTGKQFATYLDPRDYSAAVYELVEKAGGPLTVVTPWTVKDAAPSLDSRFLSHENRKYSCAATFDIDPELYQGPSRYGMLMSVDGNSVVISANGSTHFERLELFGLNSLTDEAQKRRRASHVAALVIKQSFRSVPYTICSSPGFAAGKWICFKADGAEPVFDINASLLRQGVAEVDLDAVSDTPIAEYYVRAQLISQNTGCGLWDR